MFIDIKIKINEYIYICIAVVSCSFRPGDLLGMLDTIPVISAWHIKAWMLFGTLMGAPSKGYPCNAKDT